MPARRRVSPPPLLIAALIVGSAALTSAARPSGARPSGAAQPAQASTPAPQAVSAPAPPTGHTLVWSDEFATDGAPDVRNWVYERGFTRNQELQWYQPENARVENGLLVIEGRRERRPNTNFQAGSTDWRRNREFAEYTSASLQTRGLHAWQYGVFEMRGRIETRAGLWPAFWTLGVSGGWPRNGEVDIMEYYRENLLANVAWQGAGRAAWDDVRVPVSSLGDPDWSRKFHVGSTMSGSAMTSR